MQVVIGKKALRLLLFVWFIQQPLVADELPDKPSLRFGMVGNPAPATPPYMWYDKCVQDSVGFVPTLLKRLSSDMGYSMQRVFDNKHRGFNELYLYRRNQLLSGAVDAAVMLEGANNEGFLRSTEPVMEFDYRVVLAARLSGIDTLKDLALYKGAINSGNPLETRRWLKTMGLDAEVVNSTAQSFRLLVDGQVDYVIADMFLARQLVHANGWLDQVTFTDLTASVRRAYFVVLVGGAYEPLVDQVDKLLRQYRESGFMYHMKKQSLLMWFSKQECVASMPNELPGVSDDMLP